MNPGIKKYPLLLTVSILLCTCIDQYSPELNRFESLLVVDALLTDENDSYFVKLSRTNKQQNTENVMVSGATISIRDDKGKTSMLKETEAGIYKTDSSAFRGEAGNTYTLSIITAEGEEYESEPCSMFPAMPVKNLYYTKDQEIVNNEIVEGIRIFIDSEGENESGYFRVSYAENWKINVPDPKKYNYINDSTFTEVEPVKQICWGYNISDDIIIQAGEPGKNITIEKRPILFIPAKESNRLMIRYSIDVRQLSISVNEYEFWDQMKQVAESGGNIFEKQPFPVISNVHNINNPDEPVLGYFQVSAVSLKRIYISAEDVSELQLPLFQYDCNRFILGPMDFPPPLTPGGGMTFDKIYKMYNGGEFTFTEPVFNNVYELERLAFVRNICADCTLTGRLIKPSFWVDED